MTDPGVVRRPPLHGSDDKESRAGSAYSLIRRRVGAAPWTTEYSCAGLEAAPGAVSCKPSTMLATLRMR